MESINVPVSLAPLSTPLGSPAGVGVGRGSFKGTRFHLGERWVLPNAQNGALLSSVMKSLSLCVLLRLSPIPSPAPCSSPSPHVALSPGSVFFLCLHSLCASSFLLFSISNSPYLSSKMLLKWPDSEAESRMVVARAPGKEEGMMLVKGYNLLVAQDGQRPDVWLVLELGRRCSQRARATTWAQAPDPVKHIPIGPCFCHCKMRIILSITELL